MILLFYMSVLEAVEGAARRTATRARGRGGESGQGALEYVGMLLLVAGVIAFLTTQTGFGSRIWGAINDALDEAFGVGGGGAQP